MHRFDKKRAWLHIRRRRRKMTKAQIIKEQMRIEEYLMINFKFMPSMAIYLNGDQIVVKYSLN